MPFVISLSLFLFLSLTAAYSWGPTGHRIVAKMAEKHLKPQTKKAISKLLGPPHPSLAQTSTWADEIKSDPRWDHSRPFHYVNIPKGKTYFQSKREAKGDLLKALYDFDGQLRHPQTPRQGKIQALKFLVHFVADLHQPLHVGYKKDRGGNKIKIKWFGKETNLHALWDFHLINHSRLSYTEYVAFIDHFSPEEKKKWQKGHYLEWAHESQELRDALYDLGERASHRYYYRHKDLLNRQLKKAALRLARILEDIFRGHPLPKREQERALKLKKIN